VLDQYLREKNGVPVDEAQTNTLSGANGGNGGGQALSGTSTIEEEAAMSKMKIGDLCPECGEAAVVNEEGCRKCYACGYSEC
jgi:ribonucleoside-diphosphate reductase alpha chain